MPLSTPTSMPTYWLTTEKFGLFRNQAPWDLNLELTKPVCQHPPPQAEVCRPIMVPGKTKKGGDPKVGTSEKLHDLPPSSTGICDTGLLQPPQYSSGRIHGAMPEAHLEKHLWVQRDVFLLPRLGRAGHIGGAKMGPDQELCPGNLCQ